MQRVPSAVTDVDNLVVAEVVTECFYSHIPNHHIV